MHKRLFKYGRRMVEEGQGAETRLNLRASTLFTEGNAISVHPIQKWEFENLMAVPQYSTACGTGRGMAACPSLGLLVTSEYTNNTLSVWSIPSDGGGGAGTGAGLTRVCILGGEESPAPMQFKFLLNGFISGYLAFIPSSPGAASRHFPHLLLVTDAGHSAVHIVDVRGGGTHMGYVAAPGSIAGPRGVAACGDLVAVSSWKLFKSGVRVVHIYRAGSGGSKWTHVRVIGDGFNSIDGRMKLPYGLRFSADGAAICVADCGNRRVSVFRVDDGVFVRHIAKGLMLPFDVEEVEGGWVVACDLSHTVEFMSDGGGGRPFLGRVGGRPGIRDGEFYCPASLALVPGLGLIVRDKLRLQVFSTPDMLAMRAMSDVRVGWMTATYRAVVNRHLGSMQ